MIDIEVHCIYWLELLMIHRLFHLPVFLFVI